MAVALTDPDLRKRVWAEHRGIWEQISAGHAEAAEHLAAAHTAAAAAETCRRLAAATNGTR